MLLNLFAAKPDHPLADAKEFKRVLAELPPDNAFKAAEEIYGWFESLQVATDFRADIYFDVIRQLDEAAQAPMRRILRDYVHSPRLSKGEERRLWSMGYNYWGEVASLYARCIERQKQNPKEKGADTIKAQLPLIAGRLMAARTAQLKWVEFRYGPIGEDLWRGLGHAFLSAEQGGYAHKPAPLYPAQSNVASTSVAQQYLRAMVIHASSMDNLMPLEIELADRLITYFLPRFVFSDECHGDSLYWVDAASGMSPLRLARRPEQASPSLRFVAPGSVPQALAELMRAVERGALPQDLNLGGEYSAKALLPVLRHLALYWAAEPPQREHKRHPVKTRISVLQGFDDCFTVFAGDVARLGKERTAESWVVENVSLGGFGAAVDELADWLKIGTLLAIQPEGGENWVLGVVRRFNKDSDAHASVGIQSLSRQATSIQLRPRTTGFSATGAIPGLVLREGTVPEEVRLVLPIASFDVRESLDYSHEGRNYLLTPIELIETGTSFEIARYREQRIE